MTPGKRASHKRPRIESCLSGPETLQRPVSGPNSASCDGQLNCGSIHKQTGRNTVSTDVCSPVEDYDLVPSLPHNSESQAHSRVPEPSGRPSVQVESGSINRMVTTSTGVQTDLPEVVHSPRGPICHSSEPQASTVRVSNPRPKGLGHRCSKHKLDSSRNLPKWNLSVVLNELTKAPFEPMKDTDFKHLNLKTAFLLALASGKRRSEIHAWVAKYLI